MYGQNFNASFEEEDIPEFLYDELPSSYNCNVDDIQNITFGPALSRFWLFRKNTMCTSVLKFINKDDATDFKAW
jgi:hypothetical protein